jgi:hypothetical protein
MSGRHHAVGKYDSLVSVSVTAEDPIRSKCVGSNLEGLNRYSVNRRIVSAYFRSPAFVVRRAMSFIRSDFQLSRMLFTNLLVLMPLRLLYPWQVRSVDLYRIHPRHSGFDIGVVRTKPEMASVYVGT